MALVSVTVIKGNVDELSAIPAVQLLKGCVELADAPVKIWCKTDLVFKHSLKGSFGNV